MGRFEVYISDQAIKFYWALFRISAGMAVIIALLYLTITGQGGAGLLEKMVAALFSIIQIGQGGGTLIQSRSHN